MTKQEKLQLQKENIDKAIAFKEGFFYKVYNQGAFLLQERKYKVQCNGKANLKCVYIGFTEDVLQNMKNEYTMECIDDCFYIQSSSIFDEVQYKSWFELQLALIVNSKSNAVKPFEKNIIEEISNYPLANKMPIEVFIWVSTLQSRIVINKNSQK